MNLFAPSPNHHFYLCAPLKPTIFQTLVADGGLCSKHFGMSFVSGRGIPPGKVFYKWGPQELGHQLTSSADIISLVLWWGTEFPVFHYTLLCNSGMPCYVSHTLDWYCWSVELVYCQLMWFFKGCCTIPEQLSRFRWHRSRWHINKDG